MPLELRVASQSIRGQVQFHEQVASSRIVFVEKGLKEVSTRGAAAVRILERADVLKRGLQIPSHTNQIVKTCRTDPRRVLGPLSRQLEICPDSYGPFVWVREPLSSKRRRPELSQKGWAELTEKWR